MLVRKKNIRCQTNPDKHFRIQCNDVIVFSSMIPLLMAQRLDTFHTLKFSFILYNNDNVIPSNNHNEIDTRRIQQIELATMGFHTFMRIFYTFFASSLIMFLSQCMDKTKQVMVKSKLFRPLSYITCTPKIDHLGIYMQGSQPLGFYRIIWIQGIKRFRLCFCLSQSTLP